MMTKLGNIINLVTYDPILRRYGRKMPFLVVNNEFCNIDDPKCKDAEKTALHDMAENGEYIHPDLVKSA